MNEREMIKKAISKSMPDIESVRKTCIEHNTPDYNVKVNKNNHLVKRLITIAFCGLLALTAIYVVHYSNKYNANIINKPEVRKPVVSETQQMKPKISSAININELTELPSVKKMNIALKVNDFIRMNKQELCDFYGINVFPPVIPKDMSETSNSVYGIYKRNKRTGEVYFSQNIINYYNSAATRNINIEISKDQLPHSDIASFRNNKYKKSEINKNDLFIGHFLSVKNDYYFAEFIYHNVGFRITTDNLSKTEFIDLLSSILK